MTVLDTGVLPRRVAIWVLNAPTIRRALRIRYPKGWWQSGGWGMRRIHRRPSVERRMVSESQLLTLISQYVKYP
jgi:hypothetical protein